MSHRSRLRAVGYSVNISRRGEDRHILARSDTGRFYEAKVLPKQVGKALELICAEAGA